MRIRAVPLAIAVSLVVGLGATGGPAVARPADRGDHAGVVNHYPAFLRYGYLVGDRARFDRLKAEAIRRAAARHLSQTRPSTSEAPVANPSFQGAYDTEGAPPDTTGAIGPQSFVEAVNSRIDIYSGGTRSPTRWDHARAGSRAGSASTAIRRPCMTSARTAFTTRT